MWQVSLLTDMALTKARADPWVHARGFGCTHAYAWLFLVSSTSSLPETETVGVAVEKKMGFFAPAKPLVILYAQRNCTVRTCMTTPAQLA